MVAAVVVWTSSTSKGGIFWGNLPVLGDLVRGWIVAAGEPVSNFAFISNLELLPCDYAQLCHHVYIDISYGQLNGHYPVDKIPEPTKPESTSDSESRSAGFLGCLGISAQQAPT